MHHIPSPTISLYSPLQEFLFSFKILRFIIVHPSLISDGIFLARRFSPHLLCSLFSPPTHPPPRPLTSLRAPIIESCRFNGGKEEKLCEERKCWIPFVSRLFWRWCHNILNDVNFVFFSSFQQWYKRGNEKFVSKWRILSGGVWYEEEGGSETRNQVSLAVDCYHRQVGVCKSVKKIDWSLQFKIEIPFVLIHERLLTWLNRESRIGRAQRTTHRNR